MMNRICCLLFGHPKPAEGENALLRLRKRDTDAVSVSATRDGRVTVSKSKAFKVVDVFRCRRCRGVWWTEWEDWE